MGRFMQTDPVSYGAGINWYRYCANNPVGALAAAAGGHTYALGHNVYMSISNIAGGQSIWDALNNADLGTWFDPKLDQFLIYRRFQDAHVKKGDIWGNFVPLPSFAL